MTRTTRQTDPTWQQQKRSRLSKFILKEEQRLALRSFVDTTEDVSPRRIPVALHTSSGTIDTIGYGTYDAYDRHS